METYENPWIYNGTPLTSDDIPEWIGFVYLITNLKTNKKYIGQKKFFSKVKRMKNKRPLKKIIESDWKTYYGSSLELQADVMSEGKGNFRREVIRLCRYKAEMNYYEMKKQISEDVLLRDDYYNSYIGGRITRKHLVKTRGCTQGS